jgi:hypothetical protein
MAVTLYCQGGFSPVVLLVLVKITWAAAMVKCDVGLVRVYMDGA